MKPEKLILENFGAFAGRTEIDFTALDDIFLITGKTGSGKTTVFDALCFALYGTVPGSRRGHIGRLRSDYSPGGNCSVSLDFSLGEKRYRVNRSPKQEKLKKRGKGAVKTDESAELYEISRGALKALSSRKSEADSGIRDLIGLEAEEFFKIVLLPQGEFAEFLKQNTTERREVLGKLFPVNRAIRLRELAQERAREAAIQSREAERALGDIVKRVSFDTYEDAHARAEEALRRAGAKTASVNLEADRIRRLLELRETEQRHAERLEAVKAEAAAAEDASGAMEEKESRLALSRQAQPLRRYLVLAEETRKTLEQAEAAMTGILREKAAAQTMMEAGERQKEEIALLEKELPALHEKRPVLLEMAAEAEELRIKAGEINRLTAALLERGEKDAVLGRTAAEKEGEIRELERLAGGIKDLDLQWEQARDIKDRLVRLKELSGDAEGILREKTVLEDRLTELDARAAELERRIPVLRENLGKARREKEAGERANMAAHLAADLEPGKPCPVCGAPDHPRPAAAAAGLFSVDEQIESLEHAVKDAERDLAGLHTEKRVKAEEERRLDRRLRILGDAVGEIRPLPVPPDDPALQALFAPGFPKETEVSQELARQIARLNAAVSRRDEARRAGTRIPDLYRERDELLARRAEQEKERIGLSEKKAALERAVGELEQKHARLIKDLSLPGAEQALAELDGRIQEINGRIGAFREQWEAAGRKLAAAAAREEGARKNQDEAAERCREAEAALERALAASPFPAPEALKQAVLEGAAETLLENEILRWKEERSRIRSLMNELEHRLGQIREDQTAAGPIPEGENLDSLRAALEADLEQANAERDRALSALSSLEQDAVLLREAHGRYQELAKKAARLNSLAEDLSGRNPKKKAFDAWLLGLYLEEVAAFATRRLERMSDSRYSLLLDSEGEAGRGRAGLDLAVFDAYTGKTRPCATLSGGESFMASISLALGLADSIQARSGGVRLDAVFIDEGFGSLDEGSLDKALLILDELRDHRMVGLISHVGEMRTRIPSRIEVIKSGSGSTVVINKSDY
jgi:exonuclease SbcC